MERGRDVGSKLTEEERQTIITLKISYTPIKTIMSLTGRSHGVIGRIGKQAGVNKPRPRPPDWTEREKNLAVNLYSEGKTYQEISIKLKRRSTKAVKVFLSRRRMAIRKDPEKQAVLKVLSFCTDPAKILKYAKDSGLLNQYKAEMEGFACITDSKQKTKMRQ